ncbi:MAG TPA: DMT family transporter [Thermoplasmata archaeon]|nr:DMT family transporter [Thermoplasmata archaeon]HEV2429826.1 DMT family transporter [Thermoplasmata archaeon]
MRPALARAGWVLLFGGMVTAWGLNYLFVRWGLAEAPPLWLAALRSGIGAAGIAVFLAVRPTGASVSPPLVRDALLIGAVNTGLFFGLWFSAASSIAPGEASVLVYTFPFWVAILSLPLLGQALRVPHVAAIALGFLGVVLVAQPWASGGTALPTIPAIELVAGALAWAGGTALFKRRFSGGEVQLANLMQLLGGTLALLVAASLIEGWTLAASARLVEIVLWLGLVGTAFGYAVWFELLDRRDASELSAYIFLVPLVALVASSVLFEERLEVVQLAGAALVLASIYAVARARR